jgi:hypothetical protein
MKTQAHTENTCHRFHSEWTLIHSSHPQEILFRTHLGKEQKKVEEEVEEETKETSSSSSSSRNRLNATSLLLETTNCCFRRQIAASDHKLNATRCCFRQQIESSNGDAPAAGFEAPCDLGFLLYTPHQTWVHRESRWAPYSRNGDLA